MIPKDSEPKGPYNLPPGGLTDDVLDAVINKDPSKALKAITGLETDIEENPDDSTANAGSDKEPD